MPRIISPGKGDDPDIFARIIASLKTLPSPRISQPYCPLFASARRAGLRMVLVDVRPVERVSYWPLPIVQQAGEVVPVLLRRAVTAGHFEAG